MAGENKEETKYQQTQHFREGFLQKTDTRFRLEATFTLFAGASGGEQTIDVTDDSFNVNWWYLGKQESLVTLCLVKFIEMLLENSQLI